MTTAFVTILMVMTILRQMSRELLAEPGAVQDIFSADQEIAAGNHHSLDDLRSVLEERQRKEDDDA